MCGAPGSTIAGCAGVRVTLVNSVSSKLKPWPGNRSIATLSFTPGESVRIATAGFSNGLTSARTPNTSV